MRPSLSKAELEVARVLWDLGGGTARDIVDALPSASKRDFSTIQTYLSRLEAKGYVSAVLKGRVKHFKAKVKPSQVIRETVSYLVGRLFGGRTYPLLTHLIQDGGVSPAELVQLRALIDEIERHGASEGAAPGAEPGREAR